MHWIGISLLGLGVVWESVLPPSVPGWGFILAGFLTILVVGRQWPRRTALDWPLALLALMGGVSLLITAIPETTRVQVVRLAAGLVWFYGLINWAQGRSRVLWMTVGLLVGGVILAALSPVVVEWNRNKSVLIPASVYASFPLRVSDPVHPNIMAAVMVMLFPLSLAWLCAPAESGSPAWRVGRRLLLAAVCLVMGTTLLLTQSRGGYIAGAVGGLIVLWLSVQDRRARAALLLLVMGLAGATVWVLSGAGARQAPVAVEGALDPNTWAFRQEVWRTALWMIADFPFTGVGMGLFNDVGSLLYPFYAPQNPGAHNLYLQVGVDLGIPGLIAYLAILMTTLWMAGAAACTFARNGEEALRAAAVGALAGLGGLMVHGLVDIGVWGTRAAFLPWAIIGLVVALHGLAEEAEDG